MSRKAFHISVDFDVHAVTCPGVWLCPKGVVMLRVAMFGLSENTKTIKPCFPLLFHERFRFKKLLRSVNNLSFLQEVLKCRHLHMHLVHLACGPTCCPATMLATFKSPLMDVFYPSPSDRGLNAGVDVDLLLNPTPAFPGIISPKVEISTRVVIEEVINYPSPLEDSWIVNPVTISSKKLSVNRADDINVNRQRAVCHTQGAGDISTLDSHVCYCYNSKKKVQSDIKQDGENQSKPPFITGKLNTSGNPGSMHENLGKISCYKTNKRIRPKFKDEKMDEILKEELPWKPSSHQPCACFTRTRKDSSFCDCMLCKKYNEFFPEKKDSNSSDDKVENDSCCGIHEGKEKIRFDLKSNKTKGGIQTKKTVKTNEQKIKFVEGTKEPFKPTLAKPMVKQFLKATQKPAALHGNSQNDCADDDCCCCEKGLPSHAECEDFPQKPPIYNQDCPCRVRNDVEIDRRKEGNCKCGICSCTEWQQTRISSPRVLNRSTIPSPTKFAVPQKKTHRQVFYSSLEEYYKKLYDRAREQSATEDVQACA